MRLIGARIGFHVINYPQRCGGQLVEGHVSASIDVSCPLLMVPRFYECMLTQRVWKLETIGLCDPNLLAILGSKMNIIGGTYMIIQ